MTERLRILLVEDEALLRSALASALDGDEIHVAAAAANAQDAIAVEEPIDVLVTDLGGGPNGTVLADALVHGRAAGVAVRVAARDDVVDLVVEDDGEGPQGGAPGLGSAVLDEHAPGWVIGAAPGGGTVVSASVPA